MMFPVIYSEINMSINCENIIVTDEMKEEPNLYMDELDKYFTQLKAQMTKCKGGTKCAFPRARKSLLTIKKSCDELRKALLVEQKALPVKKKGKK
jgi:hypothetical protein